MTKTPFPQTSSIGSSGEHLVPIIKDEFCCRISPENTKGYDLIVLNREVLPIQVKTAPNKIMDAQETNMRTQLKI